MSKPLPRYLTRAEAAEILRVTPRQIDRLAKSGELQKTKLSASRSGFEWEEFQAYLRRPTDSGDRYRSRMMGIMHVLPSGTPIDVVNALAAKVDASLCKASINCLVSVTSENAILITWNGALYTQDQVMKAARVLDDPKN